MENNIEDSFRMNDTCHATVVMEVYIIYYSYIYVYIYIYTYIYIYKESRITRCWGILSPSLDSFFFRSIQTVLGVMVQQHPSQ